MFRTLLRVSLAILFIVGLAAGLWHRAEQDRIAADRIAFANVDKKWLLAETSARETPRGQLAAVLMKMRELAAEADGLPLDECYLLAKPLVMQAMQMVTEEYSAYLISGEHSYRVWGAIGDAELIRERYKKQIALCK